MITLAPTAVDDFKAKLRGEVLGPGDTGYDAARTIWNAMIDKRPALIARCAGVADVIEAVKFGRQNDLTIAIRGAGHNIAGNAVCDGGLMIDLSRMKAVTVDPWTKVASVEPGATLGDLDHESQAFGLATPLGINSTTGVAGLTLGGGFGWLTRKHGMTVDNLLSADVVTAEGKLIRASASEHGELFWALRGGGGNFGVVTRFEFALHPVGPEVLAGLMVFPAAQARALLEKYRDFTAGIPDEMSVWTVMRQAPPLPFLPAEVHGKNVVVFAIFHAGDIEQGKRLIEPLRKFGRPVGEHIGPVPYAAWQKAFDPLLTPGARNYWKSNNLADLSVDLIEVAVDYAQRVPSPHCEVFFAQLGGEAARIASDSAAYAQRDARFVMNVHGRWESPADDERCIRWARDLFKATAPYATGGVYVNFMTADEADRVRAAYGPHYDRLVAVKDKYDRTNVFRLNQNIKPSVLEPAAR
jgi:FAD/FMN-containing dehydrogenase